MTRSMFCRATAANLRVYAQWLRSFGLDAEAREATRLADYWTGRAEALDKETDHDA